MSPRGRHSRIQYRLAELVNRFTEPHQLAMAFPELRTTFGGRSYVPDVAVYRWDRIPVDDQGKLTDDFREPPDLAVEIVSPEQAPNALIRRCLWYIANGVRVALLADPEDESILVFRPGQPPQVVRGDDRVDLSDVVPELSLSADQVFSALKIR